MGQVLGTEISSSQGLKKPPKIAHGMNSFPPKGPRSAGGIGFLNGPTGQKSCPPKGRRSAVDKVLFAKS